STPSVRRSGYPFRYSSWPIASVLAALLTALGLDPRLKHFSICETMPQGRCATFESVRQLWSTARPPVKPAASGFL
ncbi:MAG: hypothetical protein WCC37_12285, partial [Candidatus Sulfotelmatobacter sp.]